MCATIYNKTQTKIKLPNEPTTVRCIRPQLLSCQSAPRPSTHSIDRFLKLSRAVFTGSQVPFNNYTNYWRLCELFLSDAHIFNPFLRPVPALRVQTGDGRCPSLTDRLPDQVELRNWNICLFMSHVYDVDVNYHTSIGGLEVYIMYMVIHAEYLTAVCVFMHRSF